MSGHQTGIAVELIGTDGNVYALLARCARALRHAGLPDEAEELKQRVLNEAKSYDDAIALMCEYVEVS